MRNNRVSLDVVDEDGRLTEEEKKKRRNKHRCKIWCLVWLFVLMVVSLAVLDSQMRGDLI